MSEDGRWLHPSPTDDAWSGWATFANHVSDAVRGVDLCHPLLFSQRTAIADHLWELGYRPTKGQIAEMKIRHREIDEVREHVASGEPAEWEREFLSTLTLTEFLLARIAEDEAVAREVPVGSIAGVEEGSGTFTCSEQGWHVGLAPARVLAECEAKRRIVEEHERNPLSEELGAEWDDLCRVCVDAHEPEPWPCPTLLAIATVYSDHPDYREEWRP